jgi:BMFP domain-containing protein YqiC
MMSDSDLLTVAEAEIERLQARVTELEAQLAQSPPDVKED